jgi:hypothetical protein
METVQTPNLEQPQPRSYPHPRPQSQTQPRSQLAPRQVPRQLPNKSIDVVNTLLVGDSHQKCLKPRVMEKMLNGGRLFAPGYTHPREGRAYCSTRDWPNSRYTDNSLEDKVPELLSTREFTNLIIQAPCNDITNIKNVQNSYQRNSLAEQSSLNTVAIVEKALTEFSYLERVLILERPPRVDGLEELSDFSNKILRGAVQNSRMRNRIVVRSLKSLQLTTEDRKVDIFGSPSSAKSDGVHMVGKLGRQLYTDSVITAVNESGLPGGRRTQGQEGELYSWASVVTSNRFSVLSN